VHRSVRASFTNTDGDEWLRGEGSDRGHPSTFSFDRRILRASSGVPAIRQVDRLEEAGQLDRGVEDPGQPPVRPGPRQRLPRATPMRAAESPPTWRATSSTDSIPPSTSSLSSYGLRCESARFAIIWRLSPRLPTSESIRPSRTRLLKAIGSLLVHSLVIVHALRKAVGSSPDER